MESQAVFQAKFQTEFFLLNKVPEAAVEAAARAVVRPAAHAVGEGAGVAVRHRGAVDSPSAADSRSRHRWINYLFRVHQSAPSKP